MRKRSVASRVAHNRVSADTCFTESNRNTSCDAKGNVTPARSATTDSNLSTKWCVQKLQLLLLFCSHRFVSATIVVTPLRTSATVNEHIASICSTMRPYSSRLQLYRRFLPDALCRVASRIARIDTAASHASSCCTCWRTAAVRRIDSSPCAPAAASLSSSTLFADSSCCRAAAV